jgi:hypothetical protein
VAYLTGRRGVSLGRQVTRETVLYATAGLGGKLRMLRPPELLLELQRKEVLPTPDVGL